jgi:predicted PurR-regulated permease PerM
MKKQAGLSLVGMVVVCVLLIVVAVLGMKLAPDVIEYISIVKVVKATAQDPNSRNASVGQIRSDFQKRALIDRIEAVQPSELDISKEGSDVVISFAYTKEIPLSGPVSLLIHFEGSSAQ